MINLRQITRLNPSYFEINREERNYAAILFAALCQAGNVELLLRQCGIYTKIGSGFGIYFEYSFIRDLWSEIKSEDSEDIKKDIIRNHLLIKNIDEILRLPLKEINQKFGVGGEASSEFLQYPGKWSIIKYNKNFKDNEDFMKICRFKWSFNIKPDIVIHLDKDNAICIEAKYESGEGFYPSSERDKVIFRERKLDHDYVGQRELQKYMMEELLGVKTEFIFLVFNKEKSETHRVVSWKEVFNCLDMSGMPEFTIHMAKKISG